MVSSKPFRLSKLRFGQVAAALVAVPWIAVSVWAQQPSASSRTPFPESVGSQAAAENAPSRLSLRDAVALALKNNLGVRVASTQVDQAAGTQVRKRAALEPQVTSDGVAKIQDTNLQALGFSFPGVRLPLTTGGYGTYDFRAFLKQPVIDREAYHNYQASKRQQDAAKLTYQDTRDLVVRQAAGYYLDAQAAAAEVEAADSRVTTSQALARLARDQHAAGLATRVDVLRAEVQLQRDEQNLLVARDAYQTSLLVLQRYLGVRPGAPLELAEKLEFHPMEVPPAEEALKAALEARADYRSLRVQREALEEQRKSARARYLPKLSINGDYGVFGRNFGQMPAIGQIQGAVTFTVFDRDRKGEGLETTSQISRIDAQMGDLERSIEQDLRKAVLDLDSDAQQVAVTQAGEALAEEELRLSEDRFRNGVTDNIEVITAQSSLQSAQDDSITARARYADARMALARALGSSEQMIGGGAPQH